MMIILSFNLNGLCCLRLINKSPISLKMVVELAGGKCKIVLISSGPSLGLDNQNTSVTNQAAYCAL